MSKGKLKIISIPKPETICTQITECISVRSEFNSQIITFSYENIPLLNLTKDLVLYSEGFIENFGFPEDLTTIKIYSDIDKVIGSTSQGQFELVVQSFGKIDQLDKVISLMIEDFEINLNINFESRPDTMDFTLTTESYLEDIKITKQDVINHYTDNDGSIITHVGIECGLDANFKYNGLPYESGTLLPLETLDEVGFFYTPSVNPLGYEIEYKWIVKDEKGLVTT